LVTTPVPEIAADRRVLVLGYGLTGQSVVRHLVSLGARVAVFDDRKEALVLPAGVRDLSGTEIGEVVAWPEAIVASPGVPRQHPVLAGALVPIVSDLDLAVWPRGCPVVAVTGTNGKTTVVEMVRAILTRSGRRAEVAGNVGRPVLDVAKLEPEAVVIEVSSFQLERSVRFRPDIAGWLNLAPDHLDWHGSYGDYAAAKARLFDSESGELIKVYNRGDRVVTAASRASWGQTLSFLPPDRRPVGPPALGGDFRVRDGALFGPDGRILAVSELWRSFPHDVANALAAAALATAAGVEKEPIADGLAGFEGLAHRVALVGTAAGISYFNDSKATTPASVIAAVSAFESVVLIAGGRNKGLDLGELSVLAPRLRAVVTIGEAAPQVVEAFTDTSVPTTVAATMAEAVMAAVDVAQAGDAVLLSPGCASFDWYGSYAQRGEDFTRFVKAGPLAARGDER
jgi:UDP-N-acetylmuramoylalanine--D-glutamate ligase